MTTTTPPLDLSSHKPPTGSDHWIEEYQARMGIDTFYKHQKTLCDLLYKLEVGQWIYIPDWSEKENYDLFVKLAHLFISDSQCCYQPNKEFTIIKRNFNARKVEESIALLRKIRREKELEGNVGGTEGGEGRIETVPTPKSEVSRN